ncbi:MAG: sirohydrochlorin chelatase [Thermogutta sp.]
MHSQPALAQTGVIIIAHGSPSVRWNQAVAKAVDTVRERLAKEPQICSVQLAYLEMVKPTIADAVSESTARGCRRIVAVPMFIAASGHVLYDVPVVLGVLHDPKVAEELTAEGITLVSPKVPIMLTPPLSEGRSLDEYALSEVTRLSCDPQREALFLLLHGDEDFQPKLDRLAQRIIDFVQSKTGITLGEWCYVGVGQGYGPKAIPRLVEMTSNGQRVLVVALFLASSARQFHERWVQQEAGGDDPLKDRDLAFSDRLLTEHPALVDDLVTWVCQALARDSN